MLQIRRVFDAATIVASQAGIDSVTTHNFASSVVNHPQVSTTFSMTDGQVYAWVISIFESRFSARPLHGWKFRPLV